MATARRLSGIEPAGWVSGDRYRAERSFRPRRRDILGWVKVAARSKRLPARLDVVSTPCLTSSTVYLTMSCLVGSWLHVRPMAVLSRHHLELLPTDPSFHGDVVPGASYRSSRELL